VKDGKWGLAYKLYRNATVFPAIVSELCEAPCRDECQRGLKHGDGSVSCIRHGDGSSVLRHGDGSSVLKLGDDPVNVRAIEAAVVRFAKDKKPEVYRIPPKEQRVAVVGAGLAGLSVALNVAQKAYPVTVFERGEKALWSWAGHPKYDYFLEETELQFSQVSVEFIYGMEIKGPDDPALADFDYVHDATDNSGIDAVTSIAKGVAVSQDIEAFLQTGRRLDEEDIRPEKHYLDHAGEPSKAIILPADPVSGYTKDEAIAEASRCMGCDCRACMDACIMLGQYNKRPQKIAVEAYSDTKSAPPFSSCSLTRETYSCNLCGYCKSVCPVNVDLEKLFHLARTGRAETGKHPRAFHDFWLRDFEWHRTDGAYASPSAPYLFFPGCKAGARSPSQLKDAAAFLKEQYGTGVLLDCCGAPAYWAGEDELFRAQLDSLRKKWNSAGKPVFVFACAYCMRLFEEFLPEVEKVSIYELLAVRHGDGSTVLRHGDGSSVLRDTSRKTEEPSPCLKTVEPSPCLTVFDPCMARGFPEMEKAVRKIAADLGVDTAELPEKNHCCGYGGHMRVANQDLYDTIVERRSTADEAPYLVYCANCAGTFAIEGKEHVHILDLVFPADEPQANSLQKWRENALVIKEALAELYGEKVSPPVENPWDTLVLDIQASLAAEMDKRLILTDDVREAVYKAELSGEIFVRAEGAPGGKELCQCRIVRDVVTIWIQYMRNGNEYVILDVWSHRMQCSDSVN